MKYNKFKKKSVKQNSDFHQLNYFFSNKPGFYLAFILNKFNLTPNQVTISFIFVGLASAYFLANEYLFLSYLLWRLHIILDISDGYIARANKLYSSKGLILDQIGHHLIFPTVIFSSLIYLQVFEEYPMLSLIFSLVFITQWSLKYISSKKKFLQDAGDKIEYIFKRLAVNLIGIEGFYFSLFFYHFNFIKNYQLLYFFTLTLLLMLFLKIFLILINSKK